jgi:hypothetical protein
MSNGVNFLRLLLLVLLSAVASLPSAFAQMQQGILPGPGWQVMSADWGAGPRRVDVTNRVRVMLSGNGQVKVNNTNLGGDPAVGADKVLRINARNSRGQSRQFAFREGDYIDASQFYNYGGGLDPGGPGNGPGWQVMRADWGAGNRRVDVTNRVRQMLSGNGQVKVNNSNLGGDPAVGADKVLRISARDVQGQIRQFSFREGEFIDASQFYNYGGNYPPGGYPNPGYPGGGYPGNPGFPGGPGNLQIVRAYYGLNNRTSDVTDILRGMARNGSINIKVNNTNLGGDPAPGADKVLTVIYRTQGREQTITVKEGDYMQIP